MLSHIASAHFPVVPGSDPAYDTRAKDEMTHPVTPLAQHTTEGVAAAVAATPKS